MRRNAASGARNKKKGGPDRPPYPTRNFRRNSGSTEWKEKYALKTLGKCHGGRLFHRAQVIAAAMRRVKRFVLHSVVVCCGGLSSLDSGEHFKLEMLSLSEKYVQAIFCFALRFPLQYACKQASCSRESTRSTYVSIHSRSPRLLTPYPAERSQPCGLPFPEGRGEKEFHWLHRAVNPLFLVKGEASNRKGNFDE